MTTPYPLRLTLCLALLSILLQSCHSSHESREVPASPARVLIIGDSISIGYFEPTQTLLGEEADVYHNPGNAQHTAHGLAQLDAWLGETPWDVIHFNHGLHDLKYIDDTGRRISPDKGKIQIPIGQYARNLETLTMRLKKTGAALVFATTTPVPEGAHGRVKGDEIRYNRVAREIMARHGVPVNDLYAFALPRLESIQRPHDVHFTKEGSQQLAEQVVRHIGLAIEK